MRDALTQLGDAAKARGVDQALPGPVARLALRALRLYKVLISPLFAGSCRYLPSCSDYTAEAIERHGLAAGIGLGAHRLCRCHPLGGSGHDPVPGSNPWRALFAGKGTADNKTGDRALSDPARSSFRF